MKRTIFQFSLLVLGIIIGYCGKLLADASTPEKYGIQVEGLHITGQLSDFQKNEIEAITVAAKSLDSKYPIMSIKFKSPGEVEIMTGVVRGPLDGGGNYFDLKKQNGKWIQANPDSRRFWVS
ncbi:hypothetical protein [Rariglobus hedericola]|uniref:Uncharacterized protein n=1 Tax=Rariglobus hedericola TaxID=2597822 RepID=A0A556QDI6_9BACT|nr:hypothetical protein [Rariglobus hedericola]TSJ74691.1 hypothetical protein FPL22_17250 [Rariglobus hedericola]